jgi:16S rRNA (guanine527-N7)-methyltransferase
MALPELYRFWNSRINVISRKDIENIEIHHILHSLSVARIVSFIPGSKILDAGTGGGFPGIPLAIVFPESRFTLVDSIGKKIRVVEEICRESGLTNAEPRNERFGSTPGTFDFITGRAVAPLPELCRVLSPKIAQQTISPVPAGMIYLKGGNFDEELVQIHAEKRVYELSDYFDEPFFETKKLVHIFNFY